MNPPPVVFTNIWSARCLRPLFVSLSLGLGLSLAGCINIYVQPEAGRSALPAATVTPAATAQRALRAVLVVPFGVGAGGHFYQAVFAPDGITWAEAQAWAQAHGGYLASIGSAAENDFVFGLIDAPRFWLHNETESLGPWLGGMQPAGSSEPAGNWRWVGDNQPFDYQKWVPGQPNDWNGSVENENRVHYWALRSTAARGSTWNDVRASYRLRGFVVEYDTPPPSR